MTMARHDFVDVTRWQGKVFGGGWQQSRGGTRDVIEPATGNVLHTVGFGNAADIADAARAAAAAQPAWAAMGPRERAAIFYKAADHLQRNFDELALLICRETGAIMAKGQLEVREAIMHLQIAAAMSIEPQGLLLASAAGRQSHARRIPLGVVGVISPFNFPLVLGIRSVAPALAVGNAVVVKPDPRTPFTGGILMARAFEEAGLPEGVLQVVPGDVEAGEAVCADPNIQMVAFTGSTAAGRKVGEACGRHLKKVTLELGGKSPLIVLEDADPEIAASNVAFGAWLHQGQICMASGRVLLHEAIAPRVIALLVEKAKHLPVGDPASGQVALGPMISRPQLERAHKIVQDSVAQGAKLEAGGTFENLFYKPTVLTGLKPGMRAFDEEVFGPVVNITTFSSDAEAVALANHTEYGLSGAVISPDVQRALRIGNQLKTGLLHINDQTVADECINPFGGRGCSGNGSRVGGPANLDEYTTWQWVTIKDEAPRYPF